MFRELPTVLVDLITGFAWGMCFDDVFIRACIAVEVNNWQLPEMFIRKHRTDWTLLGNHQSPLRIFSPRFTPDSWFRFDGTFVGTTTRQLQPVLTFFTEQVAVAV